MQAPPTSLRPTNISNRPNPDGVIYVETGTSSMAPPPIAGSSSAHTQSHHHSDLAGVLRRNQACLNCRRRKLKCDAVRPHCGTCVRSYRHALRTSPKSNPTMACEYDEEAGPGAGGSGPTMQMEDEDESHEIERKRKKRPSTTGRKKSDEEEQSHANLIRRIQELEAQVQAKNDRPIEPRPTFPTVQQGYQSTSAPSPTALLDLLSSTASAQASAHQSSGMKNDVTDSVMMTESTGLTPFLVIDDPMPSPRPYIPQHQDSISTDTSTNSRRASEAASNPLSSGPSILSPYHVFDTSPTEKLPGNTSQAGVPASNVNPGLQPSTRVEGAWRGIETVDTIFAATGAKVDADGVPLDQPPMYPQQLGADGFVNDPTNVLGADGYMMDEATQQRLLMDLFWPGWPPNLPEPNIVNDLIESFFRLVPNLPRIMHRPRLLARMALPPTHHNFPHPALLHAICACASLWCAPAVYANSSMGTESNPFIVGANMPGSGKWAKGVLPSANMSFSGRQAQFAKDTIQDGLTTGHKLLDVVRAIIILSRVFIDETRMLECWSYTGLATRMVVPLGLNVRSAELSLKSVMLPPPVDAVEREERRATVWMAFYHDTIGSAASGWGSSMSIDELTVPLPVSETDFQAGSEFMESNPQDMDSLDLWTKHPVPDAFVLSLKATILLNRVTRFVRKWKNRRLREDDDLEGMQRPDFRELANAISCFQMSFPPNMRNPCRLGPKGKREIELIAAHLLPHMATICLYEPFSDVTDPTDPATRRLASASSAIVSIVQEIAVGSGGQADFATVMHSSASVALTTAARTGVVFYRQALNEGDLAQAETHRMDIEVVRMALAQFGTRFKIGFHHAQLVEYFLDRATNPTFEKLAQHYPEHPRSGAPELHPSADLGKCIINALNIKRGYWRLPRPAHGPAQPAGISPFGSTPEGGGSTSGASNAAPAAHPHTSTRPSSSSGTESTSPATAAAAATSGFGQAIGGVSSPWTADKFPWLGHLQQSQEKQLPTYPPVGSLREQERGGGNHSAF